MNDKIIAKVVKTIFYNRDNNYYILATISDDEELTITGNFLNIEENNEYEFEGNFSEHPKYGLQFKAIDARIVLPSSKDLVISFLSGPNFVGIGEKLAAKIYERLIGYDDIIQTIVEQPQELLGIKGLSQPKIDNMIRVIKEHTQENGLFEFLNEYQIDYNDVINIFNKVDLNIGEFIAFLSEDPFLLMNRQVSFKAIDKFAHLLKLENYEFLRAKGYLYATLKNSCFKNGSTFVDKTSFYHNFDNYLDYDFNQANYELLLAQLVNEKLIIVEDDNIFEIDQYENEKFIAGFVLEFGQQKDDTDLNELINEYEQLHNITFNDEQKLALDQGVNCPVSIITGGPGTGKSTIVDALIEIIKRLDKRLLIGLCAPTGKASKRLTELTNENSMTIHKLLKFDMHSNTFGHNIFNPLDFDVLIVDEASMIDNLLMGNLLKACFNVQKLIFLGDYNQLPSVAQGQVLKDLIDSNYLYTTYLKQIYRQKEGSKVIELAYKVLNQELVTADFFSGEVKLINLNDNEAISNELQNYCQIINKNDIQIMAPLYKGRLGIDNINKNVKRIIYGHDFQKFEVGDRVIQLKNRNDEEIYNGDIGLVKSISEKQIMVAFDSKIIAYNKVQALELALAYCISIHKAQGNEYDCVILFLPNYQLNFMDNKILYTAITRAKKELIIISDLNSINHAINNIHNSWRQTKLKEYLLTNSNK